MESEMVNSINQLAAQSAELALKLYEVTQKLASAKIALANKSAELVATGAVVGSNETARKADLAMKTFDENREVESIETSLAALRIGGELLGFEKTRIRMLLDFMSVSK